MPYDWSKTMMNEIIAIIWTTRGITQCGNFNWNKIHNLKKKVRGAPEYGQRKTKIDLFREFLQKSPMSKLSILFQLKFPHCIRQFN
jgi:hypothetical protein